MLRERNSFYKSVKEDHENESLEMKNSPTFMILINNKELFTREKRCKTKGDRLIKCYSSVVLYKVEDML